ncbi:MULTISPECIES: hypothetical protein [Streptomyces]|uniref:Uncharacterized protein n=1 Tax=Streptomyces flavovirens TaxID=52258 RepID=A0ABV8NAY7_9ACTN|nr:hypothetical protein [Streptomyces sp. MBT51]MBK3592419.1 hypothetical protein [Streptomyces sp. MBT51]
MASRTRNSGTDWLAQCAPDPARAHRRWASDELAPIPAGLHWLVAEADLMRSITAMQRVGSRRLGPVLVHPETHRAWWLVPLGADEEFADIQALTVRLGPWTLNCPPAHAYMAGRGWLEKPDGSGRLTDPVALGAAFSPGGWRPPAEAFV